MCGERGGTLGSISLLAEDEKRDFRKEEGGDPIGGEAGLTGGGGGGRGEWGEWGEWGELDMEHPCVWELREKVWQ